MWVLFVSYAHAQNVSYYSESYFLENSRAIEVYQFKYRFASLGSYLHPYIGLEHSLEQRGNSLDRYQEEYVSPRLGLEAPIFSWLSTSIEARQRIAKDRNIFDPRFNLIGSYWDDAPVYPSLRLFTDSYAEFSFAPGLSTKPVASAQSFLGARYGYPFFIDLYGGIWAQWSEDLYLGRKALESRVGGRVGYGSKKITAMINGFYAEPLAGNPLPDHVRFLLTLGGEL